MEHKPLRQLREEIALASKLIERGAQYRHYKNQHLYTVLGFTVIEATEEIAVRYCDVNEPDIEFIRPVSSWMNEIDGVSRFQRVATN